MKLFYLTSAPFALTAIALRRLKVSRFAELNDPFELMAVNLADPGDRKAFREFRDEINNSKGLICFSASWSNPVLWGHYADRHAGIALGFEVPEHLAVQVIYAEAPVRIQDDPATGKLLLTEESVGRLLRAKFLDWKYEDEWRLFVELDHSTKEGGLYFYDFSPQLVLTEVILGPRCELPVDRVERLIHETNQKANVHRARIAFQSFKVIKSNAPPRRPNGA
jgi:Protein of unknown function (DUF2971)